MWENIETLCVVLKYEDDELSTCPFFELNPNRLTWYYQYIYYFVLKNKILIEVLFVVLTLNISIMLQFH